MSSTAAAIAEQVTPLAERAARHCGCELVTVTYAPAGRGWVLRLVIDRDGGVSVDDCARVSRQVSAMLDVEDLVPYAYTLEVSSPGLDAELLVAGDYRRYAGRRVRLQTEEPVGDRSLFRGVLKGLQGGSIVIDEGRGATSKVPLKLVVAAHLEVDI